MAQAEHMDENEIKRWRRELRADPGRKVSHGTDALMHLMRTGGSARAG